MAKKHFLFALSVALLLQGCGAATKDDTLYKTEYLPDEYYVYQEPEGDQSVFLMGNLLTDASYADYYAYSQLDVKERELYDMIYDSLKARATFEIADEIDDDYISRVFSCVLLDHPEVYDTNGYTLTCSEETDNSVFFGNYVCDWEDLNEYDAQINHFVIDCVSSMPEGLSDYEKVMHVHDYIITHTDYDPEVAYSQSVLSLAVYGRGVCTGYSKMAQLILNKLGIFCFPVTGVVNGENHEWDIVKIGEEYYHMDILWDDTTYYLSEIDRRIETLYDFFCVSDEEILKSHEIDSVVAIPAASSHMGNIYRRSGSYFDTLDTDKLKWLFNYRKDLKYVVMQMNPKCYQHMVDYLIDQNHIYEYLDEEHVWYSLRPSRCKIIIYWK